MKKLAVVALIVLGVVKLFGGSDSPKAKARAACENVVEVCGKSLGMKTSTSDLDKCTSELTTDGPRQLGAHYDDTVSCLNKADSCGEVVGCMSGAMVDRIGDEIDGFARGFGRKTKR